MVDPELAAQEVDLVDGDAQCFTLSESGSGSEHDERSVTIRCGVDQRMHLFGLVRYNLLATPVVLG